MSVVDINTSQNVSINFSVASVAERLIATFFDILIQFAYVWSMAFVLFGGLGAFGSSSSFGSVGAVLATCFIILPLLSYHLWAEFFFKGRSVGKMMMGLQVVMIDGSEPSFLNFFLRWILRILDVSIFTGMVALVTIGANGKGQRLGDIAAGTTVIRHKKKKTSVPSASDLNIPENYEPSYPEAINLNDREIALIKETLRRNQTELLEAVTHKVQDLIQVEAPTDHRTFLEQVVKDYNFIAGRI